MDVVPQLQLTPSQGFCWGELCFRWKISYLVTAWYHDMYSQVNRVVVRWRHMLSYQAVDLGEIVIICQNYSQC